MDEMKPGRELDALIAEKVMGLATAEEDSDENWVPVGVPGYSTDIAAAWEVVGKLWEDQESVFELTRPVGSGFNCRFRQGAIKEWGETAPHAICLAALKSVEGK